MTKEPLDDLSERFRLQSLGCGWTPQVRALLLLAIAKATGREPASIPQISDGQLWSGAKIAINCRGVRLADLPLARLSTGERFAVAVGLLTDADVLPLGACIEEIVASCFSKPLSPMSLEIAASVLLHMEAVRSVVNSSWLYACDDERAGAHSAIHFDVGAIAPAKVQPAH